MIPISANRYARLFRNRAKPGQLLAAGVACVAVAMLALAGYGNRGIQAYSAPTVIEGHGKPDTRQTGAAVFRIDRPLAARTQYSLCFHYHTTGLAQPMLQLGDAEGPAGALPITIELPRNSFGLGDVCLEITPRYELRQPLLAFSDQGNNSTTQIRDWALSHAAPGMLHPFDYPVLSNGAADVELENNFLRPKFVLPLLLFVAVWLGSGALLASCISGLNRLEIALLAPLAGMTFTAFLAYVLSLLGIYSAVSFTLCAAAIMLLVARRKSAWGQPLWPLRPQSARPWDSAAAGGASRVSDVIAAVLIVYLLSKYLLVAATPFFATWDGLVSWNKWGMDWATREFRGNYQFTYPQLVPLFYSGYYRLAGYGADDPLGLPMNVAHVFITYIGLLSLPLVYACSKALRINPLLPVGLLLLAGQFFDGMNRGYVDNALVTYNLACALLILRVTAADERSQNLWSAIAAGMIGAGAIFLKQTGIFATAAVLLFLLVHYRGRLSYRAMLLGGALVLLVPFEFYVHELILDLSPSLVEDNPFNHSIGGLLSNAAIQRSLLSDHLTWYGMLVGKMATLAQLPLPTEIARAKPVLLGLALVILGAFGAVLAGLYRARRFRHALIWGGIIGGQLLIAAKFGRPAFGDSEELRYTLTLLPALALLAGALAARIARWFRRAGQVTFKLLRTAGLAALVIYAAVAVTAFEPGDAVVPPDAHGFDTVSFDARLARFYSPDNVKVNDFLVSQPEQRFRLFTESDFVVRPHTIFDAPNKSTPTRMSQIYRPGDYRYSTQTRSCPSGFDKVALDLTGGALCRKI